MNRYLHITCGVLLLVALCVAPHSLYAEEFPKPLPGTGPAKQGKNQRFITIDFDNVDIHLFIKYISELTGKNFVVDKSVQGNVTIISPTKISESQAYKVFESVLEVHGFTTVKSGSVIKILPAARARSQNVDMLRSMDSSDPEDKVVTQLVPLKYSSPVDLKKVLTPLVSQTSVLIAHAPSGMLIITETLSNIQKLLGIIEILDVESREDEVAVIPLENASTTSLAKILTTIYQKSRITPKKGAAPGGGGVIKIVPYERVNALVVLANASEMGRIKSLINLLDTKAERAEGNIHVYYLQNATSVELAKVLNALPQKQQQDPKSKGKAAAISKDVKVMADEETNSLIITASKEEYTVLKDVIQKLDIPRRMVYLEALILEVDANKNLDFGVEWAAGGSFSDGTGTVATGFSGSGGYGLLPGISSEDPSLPAGYSFGILKQGVRIGNVTFPDIAAMIRASKTDDDINIISTPQILTTDNKKAEISVGENVPYITSRNTTESEQDYTQYEYRDVATKLSIVPHINRAEALRLEIETEVTRLSGNADTGTPSTFKRTANTTVILNDQETVVIGGIIGQDVTESEWKIPLLGDIPILGWLFKTHTTTSSKTNMFIFITPRIVRNPADLASVTMEKEEEMGKVMPQVAKELHKEANPKHADELTVLGYEKLLEKDTEEAVMYFKEALEIDPKNPYALLNMGVVYEQQNKVEQALEMYQKLIATGSKAVADASSEPSKKGTPLVDLAWESIRRISGAPKGKDKQDE